MSKIGQYNLALQEQANQLGYSTTQEALDAGFVVEDGFLIVPETAQEAREGHSNAGVDKLYSNAEKDRQRALEQALDRIDGVIDYLRGDDDPAPFMIRELEEVEKFIKENY